jgi:hypothetical protein
MVFFFFARAALVYRNVLRSNHCAAREARHAIRGGNGQLAKHIKDWGIR